MCSSDLLSKAAAQIPGSGSWGQALSARELSPSGHRIVIRRPHEIPNQLQLVDVALAGENGFPHQHFAKYTSIRRLASGCMMGRPSCGGL